MGGVVPGAILTDVDRSFIGRVNEVLKEYIDAMEAVKLREAVARAMAIAAIGAFFFPFFFLSRVDFGDTLQATSTSSSSSPGLR